eukprot:58608_1
MRVLLKMEQFFGTSPPVSVAQPDEWDRSSTRSLEAVVRECKLTESDDGVAKRELALVELDTICQEWVRENLQKHGFDPTFVDKSRAKLYTFGSWRLGVHHLGTDIDVLCVGPKHITHEMFFSELCNQLSNSDDVQYLHKVESAFVPLSKFKFHGIHFDMIYCQLAIDVIPEDLDVFDDSYLRGINSNKSVLSLNGVRNTDSFLSLVSNKNVFRAALRTIRLWAKRRRIYSNVIGFPGGISWAILVARVCQLYPNALTGTVVAAFFKFYSMWNWDVPICLQQVVDKGFGLSVWKPQKGDKMQVVTPAYPAMNSTHNVSTSTLSVIKKELLRAYRIVDLNQAESIREIQWRLLIQEKQVFSEHKDYLQLIAHAKSADILLTWLGIIESKLRQLITLLEEHRSHVESVPYMCRTNCSSENKFASSFWIGVDIQSPKAERVIKLCLKQFLHMISELDLCKSGDAGLDFKHMSASELPPDLRQASRCSKSNEQSSNKCTNGTRVFHTEDKQSSSPREKSCHSSQENSRIARNREKSVSKRESSRKSSRKSGNRVSRTNHGTRTHKRPLDSNKRVYGEQSHRKSSKHRNSSKSRSKRSKRSSSRCSKHSGEHLSRHSEHKTDIRVFSER